MKENRFIPDNSVESVNYTASRRKEEQGPRMKSATRISFLMSIQSRVVWQVLMLTGQRKTGQIISKKFMKPLLQEIWRRSIPCRILWFCRGSVSSSNFGRQKYGLWQSL